jgi:C1A family cysteine protease
VSHVYYSLQGDCETTKARLAEQPLAIAVDASDWSFYSSGVLSCTSTTINHGVLLVGYNELGNWHIKNSWGVNWGESGYIWLASGNSCAVCTNLWKVIVA